VVQQTQKTTPTTGRFPRVSQGLAELVELQDAALGDVGGELDVGAGDEVARRDVVGPLRVVLVPAEVDEETVALAQPVVAARQHGRPGGQRRVVETDAVVRVVETLHQRRFVCRNAKKKLRGRHKKGTGQQYSEQQQQQQQQQ